MLRSMFARLMAVVLAIVLVFMLGLFALFYVSMRDSYIDNRMNALKTQAYEIAYLASRVHNNDMPFPFSPGSTTNSYIEWKVNSVYNEFQAYSVVVDRSGTVKVYGIEQLMATNNVRFDENQVIRALSTVLQGQEVVNKFDTDNGPAFTVAVPWIDNGTVLGAVFVQTAAQTVYATYQGLALQVALAAIVAFIIAGICIFFITRQIIQPLRVMAQMSGEMAEGKFDRRVPVTGSRETQELAVSFNTMATQLDALEQTRRDFVANVSHELRSPMTSMQGFLQGMLDGTIPLSEQKQYMQIVLDETRRLSKLVGSLLNLSRLENGETPLAMSHFDLHETIRRLIIANLSQLDEKQLELQLSFEDEAMYVHADQDQIEQVLINLLSNAIKYTPAGGHIAIDTVQKEKHTVVTISDDGPGIQPEDAPYVFDRFYKADKAHTVGKGTGLGLAICKRIMERHHQSIRLLNTDIGAAFEFTLDNGRAPQNEQPLLEAPHADESLG